MMTPSSCEFRRLIRERLIGDNDRKHYIFVYIINTAGRRRNDHRSHHHPVTVYSLLSSLVGGTMLSEKYLKGNSFFAGGDYDRAISEYSDGISLWTTMARNQVDSDSDPDLKLLDSSVKASLALKIFLNRSMSYLKLRDYDAAVKDCTSALALDKDCTKAKIRRAMAYEYLGEFKKALKDVNEVLNSSSQVEFLEAAIKLASRLRGMITQDDKVMHAEGRPTKMVTSEQTLRLAFIQPPPKCIVQNEAFSVRVCIGNEFGLWDRSLLVETALDVDPSSTDCSTITDLPTPTVGISLHCNVLRLSEQSTSDGRNRPPRKHKLIVEDDGNNLGIIGADGKVNYRTSVC
jgi:hypothetical protein